MSEDPAFKIWDWDFIVQCKVIDSHMSQGQLCQLSNFGLVISSITFLFLYADIVPMPGCFPLGQVSQIGSSIIQHKKQHDDSFFNLMLSL